MSTDYRRLKRAHAQKTRDENESVRFDPAPQVSTSSQSKTLRLPGVTVVMDDPAMFEEVRRQMVAMLNNAVALQGPRALENPKLSAQFHEAGHAVVYVHFGKPVVSCTIWQIEDGADQGQWVGETLSDQGFKSDATTSPEQNFKEACCVCAGLLAESLFDPDPRCGSSIDEIITTKILAHNIAANSGRQPGDVILEVLSVTTEILKRNADVVRAFARDLERHGAVRKRRLEELLGRVTQRAKK